MALVQTSTLAGTATLVLDSPANRNALSAQLRGELAEALAAAVADDAVRVVVLGHTGTVFCSGIDLKEARGSTAADQGVHGLPGLLEALWSCPKPVVARVAGPARAGGVGLIAACDIAVASTAATFGFSEVRLGVVPATISVPVLPLLAPRAAHELFLTGEVFDAARAAAIGLVSRAVAPGELDAEVARYADMLARGGPRALAATKRLLRQAQQASLAEDLALMTELSAGFFASDEGQEGIRAFAEKRPARWVP